MLGVIRLLLLAAAVGFAHRAFHAAGDAVGVEDDAAVDVPRGAADRLDEAGLAAQETLLVGVEDRYEPAFGNVETFAEQVDPDQHVEHPEPQVADNLDALRSEEHTSELQSLMRISYAVSCLKKKN